MKLKRVAVLISGGGSNLQALLDAVEDKDDPLLIEIETVVSNRKEAYGLKRAQLKDIETHYIGKGNYPDLAERDEVLLAILKEKNIDLIILAGYLGILSETVVSEYPNQIVNIHPSLIPKYCGKGFYGHHVHEAVIKNNEKMTGATTHYVDSGIDTGEIIAQMEVPVYKGDTVKTLSERVLEIEHLLLVETIRKICV